jgi:predicted dithiol-disulfide oxidoreductase (DUF899 family)
MPGHKVGNREEWQAARDELSKLEAEHTKLGQKATEQRRQLPWVPVEKKYRFDTEGGKKTLAELFEGRSQLLAYNIMFGPDYELGACPGCSNLGDELDATRVHLNHRDVTLICFSRAPIDRLIAYKERMGWQFPYVSTYGTEFPFDFGLALTPEQAQEIPEVKAMIDNPPAWLEDWGAAGRSQARGRPARGPELHRVRARERKRVPHLHRHGARSVRRAVQLVPARANAEGPARGAPRLAQGRIRGRRYQRERVTRGDRGAAEPATELPHHAVRTSAPSLAAFTGSTSTGIGSVTWRCRGHRSVQLPSGTTGRWGVRRCGTSAARR